MLTPTNTTGLKSESVSDIVIPGDEIYIKALLKTDRYSKDKN